MKEAAASKGGWGGGGVAALFLPSLGRKKIVLLTPAETGNDKAMKLALSNRQRQ